MQGLVVGCTNYNDQSLSDIVLDIEKWIAFLSETSDYVLKTIDKLKESGYWNSSVPFDYRINCESYLDYSKTIISDLLRIKSDIVNDDINRVTVNLMENIYKIIADDINLIKRSFKEERRWKNYNDKTYLEAESLYGEICDTLSTIIDIVNMSERVKMFMKNKNEMNIQNNSGVVVAGNNNGSISVNNQVINYSCENILSITREIKDKLSSEPINESDKRDALEMVEEIESKAKSGKGKKVIMAALSGLKDFLISVGAGLTVEYIKYATTGMF